MDLGFQDRLPSLFNRLRFSLLSDVLLLLFLSRVNASSLVSLFPTFFL